MEGKLLAFLLLFTSALGSFVEGVCPDAPTIQPCYCQNTDKFTVLVCSDIPKPDVLETVAKNSEDYKYDKVVIDESTLPYIPKAVLETIDTKRLVLNNLTLDKLVDDIPHTRDELKYMVLHNVKSKVLSWNVFNYTKGLKSLIIDQMPIPTITKEMTKYLTHDLEELVFRKTNTKEISSGAFEGFRLLKAVSLIHNELARIERNVFPVPFQVELLFLSYNKLTAIPDDLLTEMPKLKAVHLNENLISTLNESAFGSISNATAVNIYKNPLKCTCALKWIAIKKPVNIKGQCESPKRLRGKALQYLDKDELGC